MKINNILIITVPFCLNGCILETGVYDESDSFATITDDIDEPLACPRNDDGTCMKQQDGTECLLRVPLADIVTSANREGLENSRKSVPVGGKITLTGRVHHRDLVPQVCYSGGAFVAMENTQNANIEVIPIDAVKTAHLSIQVDNDDAEIKVYDEYNDFVASQTAKNCGSIEEYQDPMHAGDRICSFKLPVAMYVVEFSTIAGLKKPDDLFVDFDRFDPTKGSAFVYGCYAGKCSNEELEAKGVVTR